MSTKPGRQEENPEDLVWNSGRSLDIISQPLATRRFACAHEDTGLQRAIISVGQVCDRGNIITFRSTGGTEVLTGFEQDTADAAEAQPARPGNVPVLPSGAEVEQHELTHIPFRSWYRHCVRAKGKESPHHESSPGRLDEVHHRLRSWVRRERQSPFQLVVTD